ncbi:hypothetical protein [Mesorhizobium australicum]|uniref:Uncharacterized protein n=1 Tax=Mesorhizobium australicum TaxID=536018 RepID=A0A1X7P9W2_9HYPH|nr:hypothetical protein [Mesorhizobium australicum]SMH47853.1 hypothetical protein SAMN02982922_3602 [Mesorhizobium australicum]
MKRALLAAALACAAWPAQATGELSCGGEGVGIDLLVGHMDVLSIARAVITIGGESWSTAPDIMPGTPITVGQGFEDDRMLAVDFTDENVNEIIARLRVVKAEEGDSRVAGGVFTFKGKGAFVVDCSELQ